MPPRNSPARSSPVWLVLVGIVSVQVGAGFAKLLFDQVDPTTLVWLRLATSTVVLLAIARPRLRGRSATDWRTVLAFGAALGLMNFSIYQSFARIPLGIAVTIEFIGPLAVALAGSRRVRDLAWVVLAGLGVVALGLEPTSLDPVGVAFALLAAVSWAAYILLSAGTGRRWSGLSGLTTASLVATVGLAPAALLLDGGALASPHVLAIGVVVGVMSSVVPYSCELVALRTLPASVFGILMSLEPAAAALVGVVLVGEVLAPLQWVAVLCVVVASAGATRAASRSRSRPAPAPVAG